MRLAVITSLVLAAVAVPAIAEEVPSYPIQIKAHSFAPASLRVPAGVRIKLMVKNTRGLPSEFESFDLNREKVVPSGTTVTVWVGPLSPGTYKFFDDFNPGSRGNLIATKDASKTAVKSSGTKSRKAVAP